MPPIRPAPDRDVALWPQSRAATDSAAFGEALSAVPQRQWRIDLGRAVRGDVAIGRGVIAAGLADRYVVLLERATGTPFWRVRVGGTIRGGPLLVNDRLYVATEESPYGYVYALTLRNGKVLWRTRAGDVAAPVAVQGNAVYAASTRGVVMRLETVNGREVWHSRVGGAVYAAPVPVDDGILVATTADSLFLLDAATGSVKAKRGLPGTALAAPATDGGRAYIATSTGRVLALECSDLRTAWEFTLPDAVYAAPVLVGDSLYVLARDGTLAVTPRAGPDGRRTLSLPAVAIASPTVLGDGLLLGTVEGEVMHLDASTGAVRWSARVRGPVETAPVVRDGQLVIVGGRGDVEAYR